MYHEHTTDDIYLIFGLVLYIFVKDMHPIFHKKIMLFASMFLKTQHNHFSLIIY